MTPKARVLSAAFIVTGLGIAQASAAADAGGLSTPTFSGGVVTSYNYNFNKEQTSPGLATNVLHSYDSQANTFTLNEATLIVEGHSADKNFGYFVQFDAGHDADVNNGASGGDGTSSFDIQEAYITLKFPGTDAGMVAGKFVTFEGIEVVESWRNPTITRGFLFGLMEPTNHVGAYGTYQFKGGVDIALGLVNGWNINQDNNDGKTLIFKAHVDKGNDLDITLSGTYGAETAGNDADKRTSIDLTGVTKVIKNVDLWFQLNYLHQDIGTNKASAFGLGVQPVFHIDDKWSVGARVEYVNDADGAITNSNGLLIPAGTKNTLINVSVSPKYSFSQSLYARVEARLDDSKEQIYPDSSGAAQKKIQFELSAEVGYVFP